MCQARSMYGGQLRVSVEGVEGGGEVSEEMVVLRRGHLNGGDKKVSPAERRW